MIPATTKLPGLRRIHYCRIDGSRLAVLAHGFIYVIAREKFAEQFRPFNVDAREEPERKHNLCIAHSVRAHQRGPTTERTKKGRERSVLRTIQLCTASVAHWMGPLPKAACRPATSTTRRILLWRAVPNQTLASSRSTGTTTAADGSSRNGSHTAAIRQSFEPHVEHLGCVAARNGPSGSRRDGGRTVAEAHGDPSSSSCSRSSSGVPAIMWRGRFADVTSP